MPIIIFMFTHLHVHSAFSFLYGTFTPEALVQRAKKRGFDAMALTDKNGLYGAVRFYKAATAEAMKPILGSEITLRDGTSLILLALSFAGYRNLCRILSEAHMNNPRGQPACSQDALTRFSQDLICLTGGKDGRLQRLISKGNLEQACHWLYRLKESFGPGQLFVEIQHHGLKDDDEVMDASAGLAKKAGLPVVATNDVAFLDKDDFDVHQRLIDIQLTVHHRDVHGVPNEQFYLKSAKEMRAEIPYAEALGNAVRIAKNCKLTLPINQMHPPYYPVPEGESADSRLTRLCFSALAKTYRPVPYPVLMDLERELDLVRQKGLSGYFLLVKDVRDFARSRRIRCTVRGSAAGSLMTYLLLGGVDPLEHDLLFERFLNEGRSDMPDVDLDFDSMRRDEVITYVMERYADQAAMVATIPTFRARGAIRKLGRAFGYSYDKIDRLTSFLPYYLKSSQIEAASHTLPELKDTPLREEAELLEMAAKISGLPYQLSVHLGGVIIAPEELASWTPLEMSNKGFPVAQYDKDDVEALGLVKLDLLGLRMHTAIQKTLDRLGDRGTFLDLDQIPLDDEKTFRLLRTTETVGVFQVESPGQRQLLGRLQPQKFSDIIAEISLFRPGPMKGDMVTPYVERRRGKKRVRYPHADLEPILKETYGVVLFQEQVLKIAHRIAGFSLAEADLLRRAMTKKRSAAEMEKMKRAFIQGAIRQGHGQKTAEEIFAMVAGFAGYGFCKAHAASFAHITYQSAFLKAHHPLEFYLGLLNAGHVGSYPKGVMVNEAKRRGVEVLRPHINHSDQDYTAEKNSIRIGLLAINGLGPKFAERILREREKGPFTSIKAFCLRVKLPQEIILRLSFAGAFLGLPLNKRRRACG
ncbi:MAG: DNA polymerase III subunit alpha [Thermodesulfobacteriota bacterium]|nr:DNA polymerase III subunit alpha [Thermodesulfobacteriota bacterium]